MRHVETRFTQDADGLPCRVIWRNTAGGNPTELVWRSHSQLAFCGDKARALVHELIDGGWTCETGGGGAATRPFPLPDVQPEPAAADAALELAPAPAGSSGARPQATTPPPDQTLLDAALARDLERLDELSAPTPGSFRVDTARLADLDGDGIDDALALLTHRTDQAPSSHHLLAYRFDGETFQPVARRALPGPSRAQLVDVVDGVVMIDLLVAQAGDPRCCPSRRARARFVLRDDQLVQLGNDGPGAVAGAR